MKKLLKYTGLFLLPILLVLVGIDIFYRAVPTNYSFKHSEILKRADSIEILIFGDSHAMYGINPEYLEGNAFNIANLSQTIYFDELLFKKYINKLDNLEYVIIPMEYTTMSQADNSQEDVWRKYFYEAQMDLEVPLVKWYDLKKYSFALSQKLVRTVQALNIYRHNNTLVNCDANGWGLGYDMSIDSVEISKLAEAISKKHNDGKVSISQNLGRIKSILKICNSKGIKVILVNLPVTQQYYQLLELDEVTEILNKSEELAVTNEHVKHLNLVQDTRFVLKDFQDADHLNKYGAKKCTNIFNEYLKKF